MPVRSYKDLDVWRKSMGLAKDIDVLASRLPDCHRYGLAAQLRRASSSIPFNISEGQARQTRVYLNHLSIALGSEAELHSQLLLIRDRQLATKEEIDGLLHRTSEIGRMLRALHGSLKRYLRRTPIPDP